MAITECIWYIGMVHDGIAGAAVDSPPATDTKLYDVLGIGKEASVADIKKAPLSASPAMSWGLEDGSPSGYVKIAIEHGHL